MAEPKRIQRRRTKGWRMPEGAVYVGRPTRFGNPFRTGVPAMDVDAYRGWISQAQARAFLRGKDLACWCKLDQPCHADVLLEIANG